MRDGIAAIVARCCRGPSAPPARHPRQSRGSAPRDRRDSRGWRRRNRARRARCRRTGTSHGPPLPSRRRRRRRSPDTRRHQSSARRCRGGSARPCHRPRHGSPLTRPLPEMALRIATGDRAAARVVMEASWSRERGPNSRRPRSVPQPSARWSPRVSRAGWNGSIRTPLSNSFSASQWMPAVTFSVISGWLSSSRHSAALVISSRRPVKRRGEQQALAVVLEDRDADPRARRGDAEPVGAVHRHEGRDEELLLRRVPHHAIAVRRHHVGVALAMRIVDLVEDAGELTGCVCGRNRRSAD